MATFGQEVMRLAVVCAVGHSSSAMTELCTGEIPLEQVRAAYSNAKNGLLEKMENEVVA